MVRMTWFLPQEGNWLRIFNKNFLGYAGFTFALAFGVSESGVPGKRLLECCTAVSLASGCVPGKLPSLTENSNSQR
jgi:hypothetical protein